MIECIDARAVCGHMKATLSGLLSNDEIQQVVGRMVNTNPNHYEARAKEISLIFSRAIQGNFSFTPEEVPHLALKIRDDDPHALFGVLDSREHLKDPELIVLLNLSPSPDTLKRWAGMTNLKSACVITAFSRSEKIEQREAIRHVAQIDQEHLAKFQKFVVDYTPRLLRGMKFRPTRDYLPMQLVPENQKGTSTLTNDGRIIKAERGSLASCDITNQLRHPAINRLVREYPEEALACMLLGYPVTKAVIGPAFPEPFAFEPPISRVLSAPKIAQKPRWAYATLSVMDCLSQPAFSRLTELMDQWEMQGVKSHDDARLYIKQRLELNSKKPKPDTFWSFDQSAYTDNLSYREIIHPVLESLRDNGVLTQFDLDVMDTVIYGTMDAKALGLKHELIRFETGSPMGFRPDFAAASITNGYLMAFAYYEAHGRYPRNNARSVPGKIVGDDACAFDYSTGAAYQWLCKDLGLKINMSKSIVSDHVAEFCGKFITKDGVFDKRKLMPMSNTDALVDTLRYYKDHEEEYLSAYEDILSVAPPEIVRGYRMVPAPIGLGEPVMDKPMNELTVVEQVVKTNAMSTELDSVLHHEVEEEQYVHVVRRKALQKDLLVVEDPTPNEEETPLAAPEPLNGLQEALIRNALFYWERMQSLDDPEQIYGSAAFVEKVYQALLDDDPLFFERHQDDRVSLTHETPKRTPPPTIVGLVEKWGPSLFGKEETEYESRNDPGLEVQ